MKAPDSDKFELLTCDDPAAEVMRLVAEVAAGHHASLFLTGGSQAKLVYPMLFPWIASNDQMSNVRLYLGDERVVPLTDPDSNTSLLDGVKGAPEGTEAIVSPARRFAAELAEAASAGEDPSASVLTHMIGWWREELLTASRPRIVHLGLGPDGHVASIFPHRDDLSISTPECTVSLDTTGLNRHLRVSLTLSYIDGADLVILSVTGSEKGQVLSRVLADPDAYPAGQLHPKRMVIVADRDVEAALG